MLEDDLKMLEDMTKANLYCNRIIAMAGTARNSMHAQIIRVSIVDKGAR